MTLHCATVPCALTQTRPGLCRQKMNILYNLAALLDADLTWLFILDLG